MHCDVLSKYIRNTKDKSQQWTDALLYNSIMHKQPMLNITDEGRVTLGLFQGQFNYNKTTVTMYIATVLV